MWFLSGFGGLIAWLWLVVVFRCQVLVFVMGGVLWCDLVGGFWGVLCCIVG